MNTIFESPNGSVQRHDANQVTFNGNLTLLARDMAEELERLQTRNAKLAAACEQLIDRFRYHNPGGNTRAQCDALGIAREALAENAR